MYAAGDSASILTLENLPVTYASWAMLSLVGTSTRES